MTNSTEDKTYNGWTNYETWGVALVLDNDEGTYNECREAAQRFKEAPNHHQFWTAEEATLYELADWLKGYTETLCGIGSESEDYGIPEPSLMAQQLLGAAISEVNFDEIADHYLADD